jgi:signal transduction histidine kinase
VRQGLTDARRALQALRASKLQDLGLLLALKDLAENAAERGGIKLALHLPERLDGTMSAVVEQGVYRIAQEALENVLRHSEASSLAVHLEQDARNLILTIEDDGRGVPRDATGVVDAAGQDRLGIRGMRERAAMIHGRLEITGAEERGTRVRLAVPCSP